MRFYLSDEEWAVIEPLLPKGGRGPKRVDDRRVLNGIFYILRTGAPGSSRRPLLMRWTAPTQRHCDVPICDVV